MTMTHTAPPTYFFRVGSHKLEVMLAEAGRTLDVCQGAIKLTDFIRSQLHEAALDYLATYNRGMPCDKNAMRVLAEVLVRSTVYVADQRARVSTDIEADATADEYDILSSLEWWISSEVKDVVEAALENGRTTIRMNSDQADF